MKLICVYLYGVLFLTTSLSADSIPLAGKRFHVKVKKNTYQFPYESSHDLSAKNETIERAIFAIHSSSYNAKAYYDNSIKAMQAANANSRKYLIIAPHFLSQGNLETLSPEAQAQKDFLLWKISPFWGTSQGLYNGQSVAISAYDVIDQILSHIVTSGNFPNLKTIVIAGHSAGGQMTNRYAAGNCFEMEIARPRNIAVKYMVMAPSTCVYFTPQRFARTPRPHFEDPNSPPNGFNNWGYGMDKLYVYHRSHRITAQMMRENYASKTILYLVGEQDKNPDDISMSRSQAAMLHGRHRLERGRIYFDYLVDVFGPEIKNNQRFIMVRNVGHSGRGLMCSFPGRQYIFGDWNQTLGPTDSQNEKASPVGTEPAEILDENI